jgi:hypothetical protein
MECRLVRETEVLGENLPQRYFCPSQNPTWPHLGLNPDRRGGKPATNRLSYSTALVLQIFFHYLVCEAIGTAATPGLLCQPRVLVKMIVEKQTECILAGETKVLEENLPSTTFVHHKIPHDQTRAAALGNRRLTTWAMAWHFCSTDTWSTNFYVNEFQEVTYLFKYM